MSSKDFLWAGRLLILVGVVGMIFGVSELKLATSLIIAAAFYATAGIILAIAPKPDTNE